MVSELVALATACAADHLLPGKRAKPSKGDTAATAIVGIMLVACVSFVVYALWSSVKQ